MESMDQQEEQPITQGPKTDGEGVVASRAEGRYSLMGKHRMAAAISSLHNQINLIQAELDELDTLGQSSLVCNELIASVESVPDPLLAITRGPADDSWDRWFRGAHNSRTEKRWI